MGILFSRSSLKPTHLMAANCGPYGIMTQGISTHGPRPNRVKFYNKRVSAQVYSKRIKFVVGAQS